MLRTLTGKETKLLKSNLLRVQITNSADGDKGLSGEFSGLSAARSTEREDSSVLGS